MKTPAAKQIRRITYLSKHAKKARIRKKNAKRLKKYVAQSINLMDVVRAISEACKIIVDTFNKTWASISQSLRSYPQYQPLSVDKVDRCVCCDTIIPEGRQICPNCERGLEIE